MTKDSTLPATVKHKVRLVGGDQLVGIRLGPPAAEGTPIPGGRLEGCLLAVVAEGDNALASDIALVAEQAQLVLEVTDQRAAGWSWTAVIAISADGIAEDPDGNWTQLLEVSTADHTFRFMAPAYKIAAWVSALPGAARDCWIELKGGGDRDDLLTDGGVATREPVISGSAAVGGAGASSVNRAPGANAPPPSDIGGEEQQMDTQNGSESPAGGSSAGANAKEPAASRATRHARRRLFGRSARSDNRHKASHVRRERAPVLTTQVLRNLFTWTRHSSKPAARGIGQERRNPGPGPHVVSRATGRDDRARGGRSRYHRRDHRSRVREWSRKSASRCGPRRRARGP